MLPKKLFFEYNLLENEKRDALLLDINFLDLRERSAIDRWPYIPEPIAHGIHVHI